MGSSPLTHTNSLICSSHPWQGAGWKVLACTAFALINGIVRYLVAGGSLKPETALPVNVVMFYQNVFGTLFMLPFLWQLGFKSLKTRHPSLHLMRVLTAVLGIWLWYCTLQYMPIAKGLALTFTGPIFTVIAASFLLSERLTPARLMAIFLSLVGAFIISRPDQSLNLEDPLSFAILLPLSSALVLALSKIFTRKLAFLGESPESLATYLLFFMIPVSLVPALFEWTLPSLEHLPWLIALGALSAVAHLAFGRAYKCAEVTFLTPFGFSKFLFSTMIGYYFFAEIPSPALYGGMCFIGLSILVLGYKMPLYSIAKRFRSS